MGTTSNNGNSLSIKEVFFLRKDIYNYIRRKHADPDKLAINAVEINWSERPALLKDIIEKRFQFVLQLGDGEKPSKIWNKHFDLKLNKGETPFDFILKTIIPRPRDLIVFVSRLFEAAYNHSHEKVSQKDFESVVVSYANIANQNLIAEMKAEFPFVEEVLLELHRHNGAPIPYEEFQAIFDRKVPDEEKRYSLTEDLFKKGYLVAYDHKTKSFITDLRSVEERLVVNRWWPFFPLLPKLSVTFQAGSSVHNR